MGFNKLIDKVTQAEQALEARERNVGAQWRQLKASWRAAWTPGRIVVAGIASGFLVGRAQPLAGMTGGGVLQVMTALSGFIASTGLPEVLDDAAAPEQDDAEETNDATTAASSVMPAAAYDPLLDHEALRREGLL